MSPGGTGLRGPYLQLPPAHATLASRSQLYEFGHAHHVSVTSTSHRTSRSPHVSVTSTSHRTEPTRLRHQHEPPYRARHSLSRPAHLSLSPHGRHLRPVAKRHPCAVQAERTPVSSRARTRVAIRIALRGPPHGPDAPYSHARASCRHHTHLGPSLGPTCLTATHSAYRFQFPAETCIASLSFPFSFHSTQTGGVCRSLSHMIGG